MGAPKAVLFAFAAIFAATGANAADVLQPLAPLPDHVPAPAPVAEFSGWYLRGDMGASIAGSTRHTSTFAPGFVDPDFQALNTSIEGGSFAGIGAGYKFNSYFRADVTAEYRMFASYRALASYNGSSFAGSPCTTCYDLYRANFGGGVFLANGYLDLGTFANVTPFVGVGVGGAYNVVKDITDIGLPTTGFGYGKGGTRFHFAWALMAGLAYQVNDNLALEIGYRYLDRGDAQTGVINCTNTETCANERQEFRVTSHDLRFGMRWHFADAVKPYAATMEPLVRKY